jgi:hypothetical protein
MLPAALAAAVLAGLAFGVGASLAGDGDSATAQFRKNRAECAAPSDHKFIGTAKLTETGNTITVKATLHGAEPGEYQLQLWVPLPVPIPFACIPIGDFGKFKVDASGNGSKSGSFTLPTVGATYFLDAFNTTTNTDNDSDPFDL